MLQLSSTLLNIPIVSLRTGGVIGTALEPIINPHNLKIEGWFCQDAFNKQERVLLSQDVRDFIAQGMVVNDHEALSEPDELVRLENILKMHFQLLDKPVYTVSKKKLGKVGDYAAEVASLYIQKLYVVRPVYRSLTGGQLSIDRTQIIEITNKKVVIKDIEGTVPHAVPAALAP